MFLGDRKVLGILPASQPAGQPCRQPCSHSQPAGQPASPGRLPGQPANLYHGLGCPHSAHPQEPPEYEGQLLDAQGIDDESLAVELQSYHNAVDSFINGLSLEEAIEMEESIEMEEVILLF